jgi:hypothetical protein
MTSMAATVIDRGQQPSSSVAAGDDSVNHNYITISGLLQYMANNDGGGDGEQADVLEFDDVELFQNLANRMDQDDVLFGNLKWLENFKEMKQATIDTLYKDCPKHRTTLCFNL